MPECPNPHSSAHGHSYFPGLVASNQALISRPGTASCLMRKLGTKKLWITSCDLRTTRIGLLTGTCISSRNVLSSAVPNLPSGPGYETCQLNCLALTWTTKSVGGCVILIFDHAGTLRNVSTTRISAGTTVHAISSVVLPWVYRAR